MPLLLDESSEGKLGAVLDPFPAALFLLIKVGDDEELGALVPREPLLPLDEEMHAKSSAKTLVLSLLLG